MTTTNFSNNRSDKTLHNKVERVEVMSSERIRHKSVKHQPYNEGTIRNKNRSYSAIYAAGKSSLILKD